MEQPTNLRGISVENVAVTLLEQSQTVGMIVLVTIESVAVNVAMDAATVDAMMAMVSLQEQESVDEL
jgi:hypothetical protein